MKKKILLGVYILVLAFAGAFIFNELDYHKDIFGSEKQVKYTMYIGLNDGDTNEPTFGIVEARTIMFMIVKKYTGGCTFYEAQGYYYDEEKQVTITENTLVCVLLDIDEESVKKIMDEAIKTFNQNSILLETSDVKSIFYSL